MRDVDLTIRDATLKDAADIGALMCELGYPTGRKEMETRLQSILKNPAYKTVVAEMNGEICGMIGTVFQPSYEHDDQSGRIVVLVVSERARRRGIGRGLIATAECDFAHKGVTRIALTTRLTREGAHNFYSALGYERNGWRFVKELPSATD